MNKFIAFILCALSLSAHARMITPQAYSQLFKEYNACFILYDLNAHKTLSKYNPNNRCKQRISPDSTFKIPLSLMAFNQGIIDQNTVFKWDGSKGVIPEHERDHTPKTWITYSVVWVSQQLGPKLGMERTKRYLAAFRYGNQDFSGDYGKNNGLTHAWLSSSLKISAEEQLNFLSALLSDELPITQQAVTATMDNMYLGTLNNGARYFGKTGSGNEATQSKLRDGWFVGFIEQGSQRYIFVSNLTDKNIPKPSDHAFGSALLKPITLKLLNDYFSE